MKPEHMCGISCWRPLWLQKYANSKMFLIVYGLLGTTQAMAFLYMVVTLTTLEKRFKIPSQTTGLILSGNEISQILLSLILSYAGGQRNRPRWISWGVVFCAISCFILALPHFMYGAGEDVLHLTKEYMDDSTSLLLNSTTPKIKGSNKLCFVDAEKEDCNERISVIPLIFIFVSQFVLGIGNTLYYSLGQTYLDDNTKKTKTSMMLAYAMSLRMLGPLFGFMLGYITLNIFIDPTKTPMISNKDPRWLGAWWLGWLIIGCIMLGFAILIGVFPKEMLQAKIDNAATEIPKALLSDDTEEESSGTIERIVENKIDAKVGSLNVTDFTTALIRLLKNKLLMYNILSGIFYVLGASGYMTFISKYMEVQFNKTSADATIITGPTSMIGLVIGFITSGIVITKYKPKPRKLFFWNVLVGLSYIIGQIGYLFFTCDNGDMLTVAGLQNLTNPCNAHCSCENVPYSPVCHEATTTTYFSPCHAGCTKWEEKSRIYTQCNCTVSHWDISTESRNSEFTEMPFNSTNEFHEDITTKLEFVFKPTLSKEINGDTDRKVSPYNVIEHSQPVTEDIESGDVELSTKNSYSHKPNNEEYHSRKRRSINISTSKNTNDHTSISAAIVIPGACLAGCAFGFYMFAVTSLVCNFLGATGRIGNVLLNFRAVSKEEKSFSQGLALMMISLFALIPGPIFYGYIIDKTCLVWTFKCGDRGNCQLYDQTRFRYYMNLTGMAFTFLGAFFDLLVWYYGQNIDLYGEEEEKQQNKLEKKNQHISPLLAKKL